MPGTARSAIFYFMCVIANKVVGSKTKSRAAIAPEGLLVCYRADFFFLALPSLTFFAIPLTDEALEVAGDHALQESGTVHGHHLQPGGRRDEDEVKLLVPAREVLVHHRLGVLQLRLILFRVMQLELQVRVHVLLIGCLYNKFVLALYIQRSIASFFGHASPRKENVLVSHVETGLLVTQEKHFLFWTDACLKKLARETSQKLQFGKGITEELRD